MCVCVCVCVCVLGLLAGFSLYCHNVFTEKGLKLSATHSHTESADLQICPGPDGELHHNAVCPVDVKSVPGGSLPDIQNTDFTIEFLKNRSMDNKPFFVGMGYHRPHLPFAYPKEFLGQCSV